jgi:putative DNA primase/helicase
MNHDGHNGKHFRSADGDVGAPIQDWDDCLRTYKQEGVWDSEMLGPPPGHVDCRVPPHILQYYGYDLVDIVVDAPRSAPGDGNGHADEPLDSDKDAQAREVGQDWPDHRPLPASLLPVNPFSLDLMPEKLRPWVADVTERMQCPPDFVAVSLLAGLGSLIGRKIVIRPQVQNDWQVASNMWALLIGRPGVLKSPAMEEALRPLKRLSAKAEEAFKKARLEYEVVANVAKLRAQENKKKAEKILRKEATADISYLLSSEEEPPEPTLRRHIANDTNVASLGVLLQQNPNGLLVFRDELVSLLDNLDREENASERGFYLTGWNGDSSYTFDRIARGLHLHIDGVCLSMLGSTQPGRISQYLSRAVRGGRGDDGLIQRFGLLVWPDVSSSWTNVDRWPNKEARADAFNAFERLEGLDWHTVAAKRDRGADGDEEGLPYLRFGLDAYERFVVWRTELEERLRSDLHPALESHLSKYRKLVPGLALLFNLVDGGTGFVGLIALERALAWAKYLETHARRAYGSVTTFATTTAMAIVAKIVSGDLKTEFRSHEVWRPGWSNLADREAVRAALDMLVDYDWLRVRRVETAGRPALIYVVNPKILRG